MLIRASQLRAAVRNFLSFKNFRIIFNYVSVCGSVPTERVGLCMRVCGLQSMRVCARECAVSRVCGFVHMSVPSPECGGLCM